MTETKPRTDNQRAAAECGRYDAKVSPVRRTGA